MKTKLAVLLTAIMFLTCVNVGTVEAASNKAANKKMTYDEYVTYLTGLAEIEEARFGSIDADTGDYGRINNRATAVSGNSGDEVSARSILTQLAKFSEAERERFMECLYDPSTWEIVETHDSYYELVDCGVPNTTNGSGGDPEDGRFQYGDRIKAWDTTRDNCFIGDLNVCQINQDCAGYLWYGYKFDRITKYDVYVEHNFVPGMPVEIEYTDCYISSRGTMAYGEYRASIGIGPVQDLSIQIGTWLGTVRADVYLGFYSTFRKAD